MNKERLPQDLESPLNLVIEELFTNMLKYNSGNTNKILFELNKDRNKILMILTEFDVDRFDIRTATDYNTTQNLKERPIGKVGLHLVKKYVDDIQYEYHDRTSKIILIKYLGEKYV
jgi:anti-sigma regulatory factor (Ser/Thr protein kinase)